MRKKPQTSSPLFYPVKVFHSEACRWLSKPFCSAIIMPYVSYKCVYVYHRHGYSYSTGNKTIKYMRRSCFEFLLNMIHQSLLLALGNLFSAFGPFFFTHSPLIFYVFLFIRRKKNCTANKVCIVQQWIMKGPLNKYCILMFCILLFSLWPNDALIKRISEINKIQIIRTTTKQTKRKKYRQASVTAVVLVADFVFCSPLQHL